MANDMLQQVEKYNELVNQYQKLDDQIDTLLTNHYGHTSAINDDVMQQYRHLARQRDDIVNAMRQLEQLLFVDDSQ